MASSLQLKPIESKSEWDDLLLRCREVDLQQTWEYGEALGRQVGWSPSRHVAVAGEAGPVAMAQTVVKDVPVLGKVARMQHGPMFLDDEGQFVPESAVAAVEAFRRHWVDEQSAVLHLSPCLMRGDLPDGWAESVGLEPANEEIWMSVRCDLTQAPDAIFDGMKRRWRSPIRKARAAGLKVEFSRDDEAFEFFIDKYKQATAQKGFMWPSPDLVQQLRAEAPDCMATQFAVLDGERIAGMVLMRYAKTSFALVAWNGPKSGKYMAHASLMWEAILHCREAGCLWFDLAGIDPVKLPGITQFKRGLRGHEYSFIGAYEAKPAGANERMARSDYRDGLGHVFPGLAPPAGDPTETQSAPGDDVMLRVSAILAEFIRQATGLESQIDKDMSLIESGLLDSLSIVSLIQALQDAFDVQIAAQDVTIENFDRPAAICALIRDKFSAA